MNPQQHKNEELRGMMFAGSILLIYGSKYKFKTINIPEIYKDRFLSHKVRSIR
jgi:hypothetical protein